MKSNKKPYDPTSMYMTVEQAAWELQIGRTLAYRLADEYLATDGLSGMPVKCVGRLLRVLRSELEAWAHVSATNRTAVTPTPQSATTSVSSPVSKARAPKARTRRSASTVEQPALPFSA